MSFPRYLQCLHVGLRRVRPTLGWLLLGTGVLGGSVLTAAQEARAETSNGSVWNGWHAAAVGERGDLGDERLAEIRGRYVDPRALAGQEGEFVILWDERPSGSAGGKGQGNGKSLSSGFGNQQHTRVTSHREQ